MENKSNSMNITIKSIIDIIFRNKLIIIIAFTLCIIVTLIGIQFVTPVYDANVKMLVRGQNIISSETYAPIMGSVHMTQAEIVKSYPVLKRAVIALDLHKRSLDFESNYCSEFKKYYIKYKIKKAEKELIKFSIEKQEEMKLGGAIGDLRDRITVSMVPGTDIFTINVKAFTPDEAIETANVVSRSYTMFDQIQQLAEVTMRYGEFHPTVIQLKDNINYATENLSGKPLPDIEAMGTASVKIIEQAISSNLPVSKPKRIIIAVALVISAGLSFGLAIVKGLFDRTIKTPQEIVDHLDIPCIGSIPKKKRKDKYLITDDSPDTKYYSFYEELSEQLFVFLKTQGLKTAVVTSPSNNKNHNYIVPNIGYFLSRIMGNNVLLIELNFDHPNFQKIYSLNGEKQIDSDFTPALFQDIVYKMDRGPEIITVKKNNEKILTLLRNINFESFIESIKNKYDAILIDATSINSMKDVSFISEYCDGTVVVIDEGTLQKLMLKNSLNRLRRNDALIIGGILNNRTFPIPDFIYKNFKYFID